MADALGLLAAAFLVTGTAAGVFLMLRSRRPAEPTEAALREELQRTDGYIDRIGHAATSEELDRMADDYRNNGRGI